jgi:hypothetical protein
VSNKHMWAATIEFDDGNSRTYESEISIEDAVVQMLSAFAIKHRNTTRLPSIELVFEGARGGELPGYGTSKATLKIDEGTWPARVTLVERTRRRTAQNWEPTLVDLHTPRRKRLEDAIFYNVEDALTWKGGCKDSSSSASTPRSQGPNPGWTPSLRSKPAAPWNEPRPPPWE